MGGTKSINRIIEADKFFYVHFFSFVLAHAKEKKRTKEKKTSANQKSL